MTYHSPFFALMAALTHAAGRHCDWQVVAFFRSLLVLIFVGLYARARGARTRALAEAGGL